MPGTDRIGDTMNDDRPRRYTLLDHVLVQCGRALRATSGPSPAPARPSPAASVAEAIPALGDAERRRAAALMRVNHAGEVAAQALYHGQALGARRGDVRRTLERAAEEENDHLEWCAERVAELGARTSRLGGLWYFGSFLLGAAAGAAGDRVSLGFLAETERQVVAHLDDHLDRLPERDAKSRAILVRMREDEAAHAGAALAAGAAVLPAPLRALMRRASRIMTTTAYRL